MTTTNLELDRDSIGQIDSTDQLTDVLAIPEHLRDALWKAESAQLKEWDSPAGLVVAGMGGSAMGGALARAALGDTASRPILSARAYGLPPWTTPDTTVLCASYSGDTEETLAAYEAAGALGATRVVATSGGKLAELARADGVPVIPVAGGLQPRAAVAYITVAALEVAARCGAGPRCASDIDVVYLTGYGFPDFRGGPLFYADTVGLPNILRSMREFARGYQPDAWEPAPLLKRLAAEGKSFASWGNQS